MRILLLITLLLFSLILQAQNIIWNGGNGSWNNPQNWTPTGLPTSAHRVIINGNGSDVLIPAGFNAVAESIHIGPGAFLGNDGNLQVQTDSNFGIDIFGALVNSNEMTVTALTAGTNNGCRIDNAGFFGNKSSGIIHFSGFNTAIGVDFQGLLYNQGSIELTDNNQGINLSVSAYLNNDEGEIDISNGNGGIDFTGTNNTIENSGSLLFSTGLGGLAIQGNGIFHNHVGAEIRVESSGDQAISLFDDALLTNEGSIDIRSGAAFDIYEASLQNRSGALIKVLGPVDDHALSLAGSGRNIDNEGTIWLINNGSDFALSIGLSAEFSNRAGSILKFTGLGDGAIIITSGSSLINSGVVRSFSGIGPRGIRLSGINPYYHNDFCGLTDLIGGELELLSPSSAYRNDAWLFLKDAAANHFVNFSASFINAGAIADRNGLLSNVVLNNQGVVSDPLPGPLSNGQAVANALTLGGTAQISNITWHTRRNGPSAGSYSLSTNTYTPNANAVGDSELWIRVFHTDCGSKWLRIPVQNPTPLQTSNNGLQPHTQWQQSAPDTNEAWTVYPNPAKDRIHIDFPEISVDKVVLEMYSMSGQLIFRHFYSAEAEQTIQVKRPHSAKAGTYRLRVMAEGMEAVVKTVVWN